MTEWTCKTNDKMDINSITHAHTPQMDGGEVAEGGDTENAVEQVQCSLADVLTRQVPRSLLRVH